MTIETREQKTWKRRSVETGEVSRESKEIHVDEEVKAAATMERADYLVHEVKTSKKQMQNILLHVQQVMQTIQQLRTQLQLAGSNDEPSSVKQDKKKIEELRKKILEYTGELEKMKSDLVKEQVKDLRNRFPNQFTDQQLEKKAFFMVERMIKSIKE